MQKIILYTCLLLFASCGPPMPYPSNHPHVNRAYAINRKTDAKLERRGIYQHVIANYYQDKIKEFTRFYATNSVQFTNVDDARFFICQIIDEFLEPLNSDEQIRPHMANYPFTWENLHILISFYDTNRRSSQLPYFSHVNACRGKFTCCSYDDKDQRITLYEEPMAVAYEKYKEQKKLRNLSCNPPSV